MSAPAARMRAPSQKIQTLETDIVIIGGGVAGCLAALGAAEVGAKVVICEKGGIIERSGSVAAGVDHYIAILEEGQEWDTPDYLLRHIPKVTEGVTDIEAAGRLVYGLKPMVKYLEDLGADFHDPDHDDIPYYRHRAFGLPGEYHINFDGHNFKRAIGHAVRKTRAKVLERVMVSEILMEEGRPRGVVAFHIRHGTVYFILAKAIIVATGDANRIGRNASGFAFDSWHMPYNTGDGHAMALRVGTKLANMEFTDCTLTPKGYSTQGLNAFVGGGAHFINAQGERFMAKYTPDAERAKRADLVNGVISELLAGRGPIYCDCTHLPLPEIRKLERTLGVDRPGLPIYFQQKEIDLAKEPFEIAVGEIATVRAGALFRGAGIDINADCASNIPGLFAAGDCSSVNAAVAGAAVMGHVAGINAGRYAQTQPQPQPISGEEQERIRETLYEPLQKDKGILYNQFEDEVRAIVTGLIGYRRDEARLQEAQRRLYALKEREAELMAADYHGVMRVNEARSRRTVAEVLATSALARRETRGGAANYRVDYPERDDENFLRIIMVEQTGNGLQTSSRPTNIPPTVLPESPLKAPEQEGL
jgi:succinate dehydrogenase/fumarate reductase flavoprotein subunit